MDVINLNPKRHPLTDQQSYNLQRTLFVCQRIEKESGLLLLANRGYATPDEQIALYVRINAKRKLEGLPEIPPPMHSAHIQAAAVDLADPSQKVWDFLYKNERLRIELGVALEKRQGAWVHLQIYLPKSGKLIFAP